MSREVVSTTCVAQTRHNVSFCAAPTTTSVSRTAKRVCAALAPDTRRMSLRTHRVMQTVCASLHTRLPHHMLSKLATMYSLRRPHDNRCILDGKVCLCRACPRNAAHVYPRISTHAVKVKLFDCVCFNMR